MTCPRCAFSNQEGAVSCVNCGTQLLTEPTGVTQTPQITPQVLTNQQPMQMVSESAIEELIIDPVSANTATGSVVAQSAIQPQPMPSQTTASNNQITEPSQPMQTGVEVPNGIVGTLPQNNLAQEETMSINDNLPKPSDPQVKPVVGMRPSVVKTKKPTSPITVVVLVVALIALVSIAAWQLFGGEDTPTVATSPNEEDVNNSDYNNGNLTLNTDIINYRFTMTSVMVMNFLGEDIEVSINAEGIIDELNQRQYANLKTSSMGIEEETEIYTDFREGVTFTHIALYDMWTKSIGAEAIVNLKDTITQFEDIGSVTAVSENIYHLRMTNEQIRALMESANTDSESINITGDIFAVVHVNDGFITRIEYDFSNFTEGITIFTIVMDFSNFNQAGEITIPQTIIDNATEM